MARISKYIPKKCLYTWVCVRFFQQHRFRRSIIAAWYCFFKFATLFLKPKSPKATGGFCTRKCEQDLANTTKEPRLAQKYNICNVSIHSWIGQIILKLRVNDQSRCYVSCKQIHSPSGKQTPKNLMREKHGLLHYLFLRAM